jgi:excisionase family DNA binding protein
MTESATIFADARLRVTVEEAAVLLGVSRSYLYTRVTAGALHVSTDARRTYVSRQELERYVAACATGCAPKRGQRRHPATADAPDRGLAQSA